MSYYIFMCVCSGRVVGAQKGGNFCGSRRQRGKQEGGDIKSMIKKAKNHRVT